MIEGAMTNPGRADEVRTLANKHAEFHGHETLESEALHDYADLLDRQEDNMGPVSAQAGATQVDGRGTPTAGSNPARPPDRQKARCPVCGGRGWHGTACPSKWIQEACVSAVEYMEANVDRKYLTAGDYQRAMAEDDEYERQEARCAPLLEFVDEMGCWPFDSRIRVKARDALRAYHSAR